MFSIILYQPQIPQNTGNIIRLCHNMGARLCLVHPLGFVLSDRHLKRSGMDYIKAVAVDHFMSFNECLESVDCDNIYLLSSRAVARYDRAHFLKNDAFVFGSETAGVDEGVKSKIPHQHHLQIPMKEGSRCLNLSNSVSVVLYEAWRQVGFN